MVRCLTSSCCIPARWFFFRVPRTELDFRGVTGIVHSEKKKKGNRIPCNTRTLRNKLKWFQQVNPSPHCRWKTLLLLPTYLGENPVFIPGLAIGMGLSLWIRRAIQVSKKTPPQQWFTLLQHCVSNRVIPFGGTPFSPPPSPIPECQVPGRGGSLLFRLSCF